MSEKILTRLRDELLAGRSAVLVSVIAFQGSVPRKDHPRQLHMEGGECLGTVGGGCVDGFALTMARRAFASDSPLRETHHLDGEDAEESGLLCGGSLELEAERFEPGERDLARIDALLADPGLRPPRLYLFGGGHVGLAAARFADAVGFGVLVHDDRADYASDSRFPFAVARDFGPVEVANRWPAPEAGDAILVATRGHRFDLEALRWAVSRKAGYLGLLGSVRKRAMLVDALVREGAEPEKLEGRLHCPVGLAIGAVSAEEIALAAAAELVAYRRGAPTSTRAAECGAEERT